MSAAGCGPTPIRRRAAALLLGGFFLHFSGADVVRPVEEFAPAVARTTWAALR
ncbi:hypothetical protein ACFXPW_34925 [Streptomyces goshikiensis]|uniref:hypothetical protein n=1 Tax=Streptomyces goshikiensis TaxID=1942 RepID=UPI0036CC2F0F